MIAVGYFFCNVGLMDREHYFSPIFPVQTSNIALDSILAIIEAIVISVGAFSSAQGNRQECWSMGMRSMVESTVVYERFFSFNTFTHPTKGTHDRPK